MVDKIQFKKIRGLIGLCFVATALLSYKSGLAMPLAVTVVLAPIYEEWIFRGWVLRKLGIVMSSVLFGVWHLKNLFFFEVSDVVYQIVWAGLVLGPVFGYVAMRTKSIALLEQHGVTGADDGKFGLANLILTPCVN